MRLAATLLTVSLNVGIALTVFAYALRASSADVRFLLRHRRLVAVSLLSVFVITPAIAVAVVGWIDMPVAAKVAIVSLSLSIIPPALPRKQRAAGGDRSYANALAVIVAAVAIVLVPALVDLLGRTTDRPYGVPVSEIAGYVFTILGVPLLAGILVRRVRPAAARRLSEPLTRVAVIVAAVALVGELVSTLPSLWDVIGFGALLGMLIFTVASLAAGHLMGGPDREHELVLALATATRHPAIAITIATANFPGERVSASVILCLIVNAVVCAAYLRWQKHRTSRPRVTIGERTDLTAKSAR
jgi:BASS family bile acid:Na+ symporter